jgi:transcriptional regulator with XRE-family HTH domain
MFYENFLKLCQDNGISVYKATKDMGIGQSTATRWKQGTASPNAATLQKIAYYFGVTTDYLLSGETKKSPDTMSEDEDLYELLEELKNNPGKRLLFDKTKKATKEDIEKIIAMVDIITGGNNDGGYFY